MAPTVAVATTCSTSGACVVGGSVSSATVGAGSVCVVWGSCMVFCVGVTSASLFTRSMLR